MAQAHTPFRPNRTDYNALTKPVFALLLTSHRDTLRDQGLRSLCCHLSLVSGELHVHVENHNTLSAALS